MQEIDRNKALQWIKEEEAMRPKDDGSLERSLLRLSEAALNLSIATWKQTEALFDSYFFDGSDRFISPRFNKVIEDRLSRPLGFALPAEATEHQLMVLLAQLLSDLLEELRLSRDLTTMFDKESFDGRIDPENTKNEVFDDLMRNAKGSKAEERLIDDAMRRRFGLQDDGQKGAKP